VGSVNKKGGDNKPSRGKTCKFIGCWLRFSGGFLKTRRVFFKKRVFFFKTSLLFFKKRRFLGSPRCRVPQTTFPASFTKAHCRPQLFAQKQWQLKKNA
jgi:hypothetical protein